VDVAMLESRVSAAYADRTLLTDGGTRSAVLLTLAALDRGDLRVAEKREGQWVTHAWVKQAILLYFVLAETRTFHVGPFEFHDKVPLKKDLAAAGVRLVPPGVIRYGAHVEAGAVVMPGYVNIGARVGSGTMDMRTAIEVFGAPELYLGNAAACDLCHFYGLPSFAYAAVSDAKLLDEQWAAEAGISAVLGALSRATLLHDVGYLEAGLQSSFETIVLGHELVRYARALMHEVGVDSESLALNEIAAVGPGGSFAGRPHASAHQEEFWSPSLFERGMFDNWQAGGATTLRERVRERSEALRNEPPAFTLDDTARRAVDEVLAERKESR